MTLKVYGYALRFDTPLQHGKVKKGALMREPESNRLHACRNDIPVYFGDYHILDECGPPAGYASIFLRHDGIYSVATLRQSVDLNALKDCKLGLFAYNIVRGADDEITDGYIGYININASSNAHPIDKIVQCEPFKEPVILYENTERGKNNVNEKM